MVRSGPRRARGKPASVNREPRRKTGRMPREGNAPRDSDSDHSRLSHTRHCLLMATSKLGPRRSPFKCFLSPSVAR